MRTSTAVAAAAVPPLVLAGIGVSHPHVLAPETATWWRDLHVVGLVAFPLLALAPWVAVRGHGRVLEGVMIALGLVYAAFYTALDAIAGIGGGATTLRVYAAWVGESDRRAAELLGSRMRCPGLTR